MSSYVLNNFSKYIKDTSLQKIMLEKHPVPETTSSTFPNKLDKFIKDWLTDQKKNKEVKHDKSLERVQKRVVNIVGHLSKIWLGLTP